MAVDVATLLIRVDASQVQPAVQALDRLGVQGVRVQTATTAASVGTGRLNNAILGLARQASGAHPVIARFTDVLFSMALGGAKMTAVLGGLAGLALAYRKLTEESRRAREEQERLRDTLRDVSRERLGTGTLGSVAAARGEVGRLEAQLRADAALVAIRGNSLLGRRARSRFQQTGNELGVARGALRVLEGDLAAELWEGPVYDLRAAGDRIRDEREEARRIALNNSAFRLEDRLRDDQNALHQRGWLEGRGMGTGQALGMDDLVDRFGARLEERKRQLDAWAAYQQDKEDTLNQRRVAANQALIVSLANVGRAYGGVTDQVLNLIAATGSIAMAGRLPGFGKGETASRTDMAIGLGSAALTGIGFGTSTGNLVLGGAGGAAAGFAMAGPYGAIVGGVTGIVSGLMEQGERAKQAQRIWAATLQGFEDMWDSLTPDQQTDRGFQRTFGMTIEEARAYAELFQGVEGADQIRQAIAAYDRNIAQVKELTEAEKRLNDARRDVLQALNAPAGLNLAAYGYAASSSGMVVQGDFVVHVDGSGSPRETALIVFQEGRRLMQRGGQSPYLDVQR